MLDSLIVDVSIIVPVYNVERYLEKCLDSLLNQDYCNYEILLVNDGSTDRSGKICEIYSNNFTNIKVYHQKNLGVSAARNYGIKESLGEWLMFVDPDDYVSETIVTKLFNEIDDETDLISCSCVGFDKNQKIPVSFFEGDKVFTNTNKDILYKQLMKPQYGQPQKAITAIGVPWAKIYRKSVIIQNELSFNTNLKRMQDNIFNNWFFYYSRKIKYIDSKLYFYRLDNINIFNKKNGDVLMSVYINVAFQRKCFLNKTGLKKNEELYDYYLMETLLNLFGIINSGILSNSQTINSIKEIKIKEVCELEVFKEIFKKLDFTSIEKNKHKIEFFLLKKGMYKTFLILGSGIHKILHKN